VHTGVLIAALLGLSLILTATIYVIGRLKIEQERTLQKALERGVALETLGPMLAMSRSSRDLRRGILLIAVGVAWSTITYFVGGQAWLAGIGPIAIGAAYVIFGLLDGRAR
jgi:Domain of unknown function (DUF6249)